MGKRGDNYMELSSLMKCTQMNKCSIFIMNKQVCLQV